MSFSRWQTVSQIFEAAIDLPPHERDNFIHQTCGGDPELESEVIRLLAADEKAGSFLERPALSTLPAQNRLAAPPLLNAGSIVADRFQIVRFIGQGGMGQVYEAFDLELKSRIALKVIRPDIAADPRMLSRFRREVQLTRMITHPNVCRTFDIERHTSSSDDPASGYSSNLTFLTMELLEGETLAALLRRQERLSTDETLPLVLQMIDALAAAHAVGVIHRDFKPSNVILVPGAAKTIASGPSASTLRLTASESGGQGSGALRAVVTDFGLARIVAPNPSLLETGAIIHATSLTGDQALMGTLIYMAPEQFERGEASVASDVYSLGLVMFEMITGQRPFADDIPFAEATKRLKQPAPSAKAIVPDIYPSWDTAIACSLRFDPKDRFETVQQVAEALHDPAATALLRLMSSTVPPPKSTPPAQRRKILAAVAMIVVVVSLSVAGLRLYRWKAKVPEGASILVTEVANQTSDQELNAVTDLLLHELSQSAHFNVIERSKTRSVLRQMGRPYQQLLDPPTARELALRAGGALVVYGSIAQLGPAFSLDLRLEKLGESPATVPRSWNRSFQANDKQDIFRAVTEASQWLRSRAGETSDKFAKEKPPQDTTTSSWEALLLYSQAEHVKALDDTLGAIDILKKAVVVDPDFALAWMRLGDLSNSMQMDGDALRYWQKALDAMKKRPLTRREELRIRGLYADDSGDYEKSKRVFQEWESLYPGDYLPSFYLAGALSSLGQYQDAINKLNEAEKKQPNAWYIVAQRARYNLARGEYDKVTPDVKRLRDAGHKEIAAMFEGALDFVHGNFDGAHRAFASIADSSDEYWKSRSYSILASLLSERGQYLSAKEQLTEGIKFDMTNRRSGSLADKEIELGYILFRTEDKQGCRREALNALRSEDGPGHTEIVGSLLARCGFPAEALRVAQRLKDAPDVPAYRVALQTIKGEVLLKTERPKDAVVELQAAAQIEKQNSAKECLARALEAKHDLVQAESYYDQVISAVGEIWSEPDLQLPGLWADTLFAAGRLKFQIHGNNADLRRFASLRQKADPNSREMRIVEASLHSRGN